ncbi:MAG: ATP-binding protein [Chitinophagaceae bacterium]|nr:ATP-binding protein [Chitinophagaceae bacterium]
MNKNAFTQSGRHFKSNFIKLPASFSTMNSAPNGPTGYYSALVHEVRNPLCNITLAYDVLKLTNLDDEQRACLNIILRGSERIKDLVNVLLKLERIESIKYDLYSLQQLLEDVLIIARDRILLRNIEVSREYAAPHYKVSLDIEKMKIALINLVNNAIDAMPSKGGELKVVTRSVGQLSFVEIRDNGIGISKDNLKRIFEAYFTNKPGGMGLGLSTTLDILSANHAKVDVQSVEGVGTSFILSFDRRL